MYCSFAFMLVLIALSNANPMINLDQLVKQVNLNLQSALTVSASPSIGTVNNEYQSTVLQQVNGSTFAGIVTRSSSQNATIEWATFQSDVSTLKDNALLQLMADQKENQIKSQMKAFENHYVKQMSENQNNPVYTIYTDQDDESVYVRSGDFHYEVDNRRFKIFVANTTNNQ